MGFYIIVLLRRGHSFFSEVCKGRKWSDGGGDICGNRTSGVGFALQVSDYVRPYRAVDWLRF